MDDRLKQGLEHEKRIADLFTKAGWDCDLSHPNNQFDITLKKDGKIYGYVDTYLGCNPKTLDRLARRVKTILDEIKPELYILTDGYSYEIYINGRYFITTNVIMEYDDYSRVKRLSLYYKLYREIAYEQDK